MDNRQRACEVFAVASLLEARDANPYRVRAYRRAALRLMLLPDDAAAHLDAAGALDLPGLGSRLRRKLGELTRTGRLAFHDELIAELPRPIRTLMTVPGIGPKTAQRLVDERGVRGLKGLARAARSRKLQTLRGIGEARERCWQDAAEALLAASAPPTARSDQDGRPECPVHRAAECEAACTHEGGSGGEILRLRSQARFAQDDMGGGVGRFAQDDMGGGVGRFALVKIDPEPPETARNERFHEGWCAGAHGRSQDDRGGVGQLPLARLRERGSGGEGETPSIDGSGGEGQQSGAGKSGGEGQRSGAGKSGGEGRLLAGREGRLPGPGGAGQAGVAGAEGEPPAPTPSPASPTRAA